MNFGMIILNQSVEIAKLCYTGTNGFFIITEDFFKDIAPDVNIWLDTSNCDENDKRPLPIGKNKKVSCVVKDELGGKIIVEVVALRSKTWAYLLDDGTEHKKARRTEKCVTKHRLVFENDKDCLFNEEKHI